MPTFNSNFEGAWLYHGFGDALTMGDVGVAMDLFGA